jgi:metallo-beta-lactamase family protein
MYLKNVLMREEIPKVTIIVDSPMAIDATALYRKHQDCHKLRGLDLNEDESFLTLRKQLLIAKTTEESRSINDIAHRAIIISGNGMMSGGRVLHHLSQRLPNPANTILIVGYQSPGSRGWQLQEGAPTIRIHGREILVRAKVFTVTGLSAHADRSELLDWLGGFSGPPGQTFVVHGDADAAGALSSTLQGWGWKARVPRYLEETELFQNI